MGKYKSSNNAGFRRTFLNELSKGIGIDLSKHKTSGAPKKKFKHIEKPTLDSFIEPQEKPKRLKRRSTVVKMSYGESKVADWLVKNGFKFKPEKEFDDLINPLTKQKLRFDFYLHAHKTCIEFDGRQHFEETKKFDKKGDSLAGRIFRDSFKDEYCVNNGLRLIRIRYDQVNSIPFILKEALL